MREMGVVRLCVDNYELEILPYTPADLKHGAMQGDTTVDPYEEYFEGRLPKLR